MKKQLNRVIIIYYITKLSIHSMYNIIFLEKYINVFKCE